MILMHRRQSGKTVLSVGAPAPPPPPPHPLPKVCE